MSIFAKQVTSNEDIVNYLVQCYEIGEIRAKEIVLRHTDMIEEGIKYGSFIHYIGDKVADAEGLEPSEDDDEDIAYDHDED